MYEAISWLQDTGVLQKMDDDMWRIYGKYNDDTTLQKVGLRPLKVTDTLAGFLLLSLGLFVSLVVFVSELVRTPRVLDLE